MKCETDFVAKNEDFVALTQAILDAAVANKCHTLDEVKALPMGKGTIQEAVTDRSGITGEKMELDGYCVVEGAYTTVYNHMGKNQLVRSPLSTRSLRKPLTISLCRSPL